MTLCQSRSLVNDHGRGAVAVTLRCRSWRCPECQPLRRNQLVDLALSGKPQRFVTVTINPRVGVSPADRAARLANAWRNFVKRAVRMLGGKKIEYLAVFEATKRGEPHLHLLVRGPWIAQKYISDQMRDLINSPIVDIRKVKHRKGAAAYVSKYIGKDPHRFATCKRYWHTKGWVVERKDEADDAAWPGPGWIVSDDPVWRVVETWKAQFKWPEWFSDSCAFWGQKPPWQQRGAAVARAWLAPAGGGGRSAARAEASLSSVTLRPG